MIFNALYYNDSEVEYFSTIQGITNDIHNIFLLISIHDKDICKTENVRKVQQFF